MNNQEMYTQINEQLFANGSCKVNQWMFMKVRVGDKVAAFEVINPSKGNIKIRKPLRKQSINENGQEVWEYDLFRFTGKGELKYVGVSEGIRLDQQQLTA